MLFSPLYKMAFSLGEHRICIIFNIYNVMNDYNVIIFFIEFYLFIVFMSNVYYILL